MQSKLHSADLERMQEVLQLPLNIARRDYHWKNEAKFDAEFGLGLMGINVYRLQELVRLAKLGHEVEAYTKKVLDYSRERAYNGGLIIGDLDADLQRQRAEERDASEGRPDESVSKTLRELPLPTVYREAISRPERTWSGFARADNLRAQDEVSRTQCVPSVNLDWYPRT